MADTIRSVVISIAVEQKQATVIPPKFDGVTAAASQAGQKSAAAIEKAMDKGIREIERDLKRLDAAFDKSERAAEVAFDKEAKAAVAAYSRIMRAREKSVRDAEKLYDQEANAALTAYSRIMRSKEASAAKEVAVNQRIAATQSAVTSAYGAGAMASLQLAKGIAFVSAANEKEAEATLRALAAAQGYFDLAVGGLHVFKAMNDLKRQSAVLSLLQASTTTTSTVATNGATAATMAFNASLLANPVVLVIAGLAAATLAIRAWAAAEEKAMKEASEADGRFVQRRIEFAKILASTVSQSVALHLGGDNQTDESVQKQIDRLREERGKLDQRANLPMAMDTTQNLLIRQESILDIAKQREQLQTQEYDALAAKITLLEKEKGIASQQVDIAKQRAVAENETLSAVAQQIGALSRGDVNKLKRIQDKVDKGQSLTQQEAIMAAGQQGLQISGAARRQLQDAGEKSGLRLDRSGVDQAARDVTAAENSSGLALKDIQQKIDGIAQNRKDLKEVIDRGFSIMAESAEEINRLKEKLDAAEKALSKNSLLNTLTIGLL